ncbi:MAG: hypothetical protein B6242_16575 [Anaerolineaceae bacterium 4572_78]|nr:MAG: hypothetical protein B6242_16575 [Anaerolineaceae bacterium 4572_78]
MKRNLHIKLSFLLTILVFASLTLVAAQCGAAPTPETIIQTVEVTVVTEGETITKEVVVTKETIKEVIKEVPVESLDDRVTLYWNMSTEPPSLDLALATDTTSIDHLENLFIGLTRFEPVTSEVLPYLATDWSPSDDGFVWTFNLRDDVPWVHYDPKTNEFTKVTDEDGNVRIVNAYDIEYGVRRTLDPATASDYAYVLYSIKNAQNLNTSKDLDGNDMPEGKSFDDYVDQLGVKAVDATTVEFTLESPAGFFPAIAGMWVAKPQPSWTIEKWAEKWTEAGIIDTSGPYALAEWIHGGNLTMVKNPFWYDVDNVQIEVVQGIMIDEASTSFAMYENSELDTDEVPLADLDRVKADPVLREQLRIAPDACTYYYGFTHTKEPFDDARIRRAFSAAIDRQSIVDNVTKGGQVPATTFAPPGIFAAPEPGTLGLGYDPDFARENLQEFLDEKGMTLDDFNDTYDVVMGHNTSEGHAKIAAASQQMWMDELGVDVRVENQEWKTYLTAIKKNSPVEDTYHIFRMGWCADYPDENNWIHEVFNSTAGSNRLRRNCADPNCEEFTGDDEFDKLTSGAGVESDPAKRIEMYAQAEDMFANEMAAYIPFYHYTSVTTSKPWLTRNYPLMGGKDFYNWKIDAEAQKAAR